MIQQKEESQETTVSKLCKRFSFQNHNKHQVQTINEECQNLSSHTPNLNLAKQQQLTQAENTRLQEEIQFLKEKIKQLEIAIDKLKEENDEMKNKLLQPETNFVKSKKDQQQDVDEYQNLFSENKQLKKNIEQQQQQILLSEGLQKQFRQNSAKQLIQKLSQQRSQIHNKIKVLLQSYMNKQILILQNKNKGYDLAIQEISLLKIQLSNLKADKNSEQQTETCKNQIQSQKVEKYFSEDLKQFSTPQQVQQELQLKDLKDTEAQQIYQELAQDLDLISQNQSQLQQSISEPQQSNIQGDLQRKKSEMMIQQIPDNSIHLQQQTNQQLPNNSQSFQDLTNSAQTVQAKLTCLYCNNQVMKGYIQTNCFHNYDPHCLNEMIHQAIIIKGQTQLFCFCKKLLSAKILSQVSNSEETKEIFFQNQLKQLKDQLIQKNLLQLCKNDDCGFFYIGLKIDNTNIVCLYCGK